MIGALVNGELESRSRIGIWGYLEEIAEESEAPCRHLSGRGEQSSPKPRKRCPRELPIREIKILIEKLKGQRTRGR